MAIRLVLHLQTGQTRVWDVTTKERLAVLYHEGEVYNVAMSDRYIMTSSGHQEKGMERDFRIFLNDIGYALVKILRAKYLWEPRFLNNHIVTYWSKCFDTNRDVLVFFELRGEFVLAQLKVGCRFVQDYDFLDDGRLVVGGKFGCRGVISTLPDYLRLLVTSDNGQDCRKKVQEKILHACVESRPSFCSRKRIIVFHS